MRSLGVRSLFEDVGSAIAFGVWGCDIAVLGYWECDRLLGILGVRSLLGCGGAISLFWDIGSAIAFGDLGERSKN